MSEDDRAAKAARAKAMLKKRQAKKAGTPSSSTPGVTSPVSERAFSPTPTEPATVVFVEDEKRDLSDVFVRDSTADASWVSTLPRAGTPPPAPPPTAVLFSDTVTSPNFDGSARANGYQSQEEVTWLKKSNEMLNSQIEQLISEKAELRKTADSSKSENETLKAELARSGAVNSGVQSEIQMLKVELESVKNAKSDWANREYSLKIEMESLRATLAQTEASKSNLQRTEANLRTESKNMKSSLAELEAAKAKLLQSEAALKKDNEQLKSDLTGKLDTATSELERLDAALKKQRGYSTELEQQMQKTQFEMEVSLRNEQQTISLLVSEKAALTSGLERLSGAESYAQEAGRLLSEEQQKTIRLEEHLQQLRSEVQESTARIQSLEATDKELTDKTKDQAGYISCLSYSRLLTEAEIHRRRVRELEEQIQSDDRADRLEASLKNTQDRADELEFQLSELKQTHATIRSERDKLDARLRISSESETAWEVKHSTLHALYQSVEAQLAQAVIEKEAVINEKSSLQVEIESTQKTLALLQEKLTKTATDLAMSMTHLQNVQNEAKMANRRAEDAERSQKELQEEGTSLMHSLDEMRPKIVELTGIKLELTEKTDEQGRVIQNRELMVGQLESSLEEARADLEASEKKLRDLLSERETERHSAQLGDSELQKAYSQLQAELDSTLARVRSLEADRNIRQNETLRNIEEVARLQELASAQSEEITSLQHEIYRRQNEQSEEKSFLEVAQNEVESLRQEIAIKDEELERLRLRTSNLSTFPDKPHSLKDELNDEVLGSLKLDLSSSQSHVRSLEESLFDAEARSHALMKQVAALEDQLTTRPQIPSMRPFSPSGGALASRPSSRGSRTRSISGSHSLKPSALARSAIEHNLSPETRHKRKTSLTMLKARIDRELVAASAHSQANSRALSPVQSESSLDETSNAGSNYSRHKLRPQFMDDSHVFWCSSCRGDLVIL
ncbi:hypothetical protein EV368DRAFT_80003 [Lentinula lateritia]|nr:hypothetical protein EV368DRAFT_80003 [Lentinula lateritia]